MEITKCGRLPSTLWKIELGAPSVGIEPVDRGGDEVGVRHMIL